MIRRGMTPILCLMSIQRDSKIVWIHDIVQRCYIRGMSKKSIILLIIVILLIFAGWEFYWLSNRHYVQKIKNNTFAFIPTTTPINTFNSSLILKKIEFIDSTGKNKVLIAVKTGEGHTSIPVVDTYI